MCFRCKSKGHYAHDCPQGTAAVDPKKQGNSTKGTQNLYEMEDPFDELMSDDEVEENEPEIIEEVEHEQHLQLRE